MNWDEVYKAILEKLKVPQTVDDAIKFLEADDASQAIIEDMAWKQTVLNVLVASKVVSEKDFSMTVDHFIKLFTRQFAEKMIENLKAHQEKELEKVIDELDSDEIEIDSDDESIAKA